MIVIKTKVCNVHSRALVRSVTKGPNYANDKNDVVIERDPPQWWLQLEGNVSFNVGLEKPSFTIDDPIKLTIEKDHEAI